MLRKSLTSTFLASLTVLTTLISKPLTSSSTAQMTFIQEDALTTVDKGLPWGAPNWPYNATVNIQRFGGQVVGKVVLDRHAEQKPISLSLSAFSLMPATAIFVTQWGSKNEGCFMEMLVQFAPLPKYSMAGSQAMAQYLVPKLVEVDVGGGRVVTLKAHPQVTPQISIPIAYQYYHAGDEKYYVSNWYMARNVFVVSAQETELLSSAKPGNARVRITFRDGSAYQVPIGEGTSSRWKEVFGYNPTCRPGGQVQAATRSQPGIPTTPKPVSTPRPPQSNVGQPSSVSTPPRSAPSPLPPSAIGSVTPAKYPSNDEFRVLNQELRTAQGGVRLSAAQRRTWQSFKGGWSKTNPPIARFLGVWYSGDRYFYVYPSKVRSRVCVIVNDQGQVSSRLGTVLNKELRNGNSSFFWIDKEDVLAARDSGEEKLYPIFATQAPAPELSAEITTAMDRWQCQKSLPQATQAQLQ